MRGDKNFSDYKFKKDLWLFNRCHLEGHVAYKLSKMKSFSIRPNLNETLDIGLQLRRDMSFVKFKQYPKDVTESDKHRIEKRLIHTKL